MTILDFSFAALAARAGDFDQHIHDSIRGYGHLRDDCIDYSRYFIQNDTIVLDIGCTAGTLLRSIREAHQAARPTARYVGIDVESKFGERWRELRADNVEFRVCDALSYDGYENLSFACSLFTLQFIPERYRPGLLRRVHDGLNEGGGLIIAEKVLARSAKFQDMMTFPYYDHKLRSFSEKSLLDKERSLRGQMVPWDEATMVGALHEAGFQSDDIQRFWQNHLFVAWIARKSTPRSRLHQSILPMSVGRGLTLPGIVPGLDDIGPEPAKAVDAARCRAFKASLTSRRPANVSARD
jgi:tRNA (cmo5U34)-methyltransferase